MDAIEFLFKTARDIYDGDVTNINSLERKAIDQVRLYQIEDKGFKGLYAKLHKGWFFQLSLVFLQPFASTWLLGKKQRVMNLAQGKLDDFDKGDEDFSFDDDDEKEHFEYLKQKYEK